jgi:putative toxin-antitoxin system antitoxin component (TIGR02293 family)
VDKYPVMVAYLLPDDNEFIANIADNGEPYQVIHQVREGIHYDTFFRFARISGFSMNEWSEFLSISERTLQRYKNTGQHLGAVQSEKFLAIAILYQKGILLFGSSEKFSLWLDTVSLALGGIKPKELLDNSFGIEMIKNELGRIEHGILA